MPDYSRYYVLGAFILGVALTATYIRQNDSKRQSPENEASKRQLKQRQKVISKLAKIDDLGVLKKSLVDFGASLEIGAGTIKEGIEGCIGDTPLIKIKSLSEYTGCEILAKAEVGLQCGHDLNDVLT